MSKTLSKSIFVFSFLALLVITAVSQTPANLELNKPIVAEIKSGETHKYQISLADNQFARIVINQKSVDISARLTGFESDIVEYLNFDFEMLSNSKEVVDISASKAKTYDLRLIASQPKSQGSYEIVVEEIRPATERDFSLFQARKMLLQAILLGISRKSEQALEIAKKSTEIREKELGKNSYEVSSNLFNIGMIYKTKEDYPNSLEYFEKSLKINETLFGKDSVKLATALQNIGGLYSQMDNFVKSDEYYQRALAILEENLGLEHLQIAELLNNYATNKKGLGDRDAAEKLFLRSIKIKENLLGNDSPTLAASLTNLADLYPDLRRSEPLLLRSVAIKEKALGPNDVSVAQTLFNLARVYRRGAENEKAEIAARRSLEIIEKTLGPTHPFANYPLRLLTLVFITNGKLNEAETLVKRSIASAENARRETNPELAEAFSIAGDVYALKGEIEKAANLKYQSNEIKHQIFLNNIAFGTEKDKAKYASVLTEDKGKTISFAVDYGQNSKLATEVAARLVLRQKGKILDLLSNSLRSLQASLNNDDRILVDKYVEKNEQLARITLAGRGNLSEQDFKSKVAAATAERDTFEREITRKTSKIVDVNKDFTIEQIQSEIPTKASLLEFVEYFPTSLKTNVVSKTRYAVFIMDKTGVTRSKDLGEKEQIDSIIKQFRQSLQDPKNTTTKQIARDLDEKIMSPIRELLGDSTQLLISPDGELNLIPFEVLIDKNGKYLVENYSISYLSSGRDLLRMQNTISNNNAPMILANPAFGEFAVAQTIKTNKGKRSVNVAKNLSETYFAPLSGTEKEGQEIKKLFPNATLLTNEKASENALKESKSPSILHIATHGFFIEPDEKSIENGNPLLRSGLALAGANSRSEKDTDGIFTALEGAGLNLFGTKLVVLSACGTGLGEIQTGEGVFGLRRSFVLAGSESLVISLWSVSDYITRELMINYYKNLKAGHGRGESLRKAQLEMLKKPNRQHPFYWASFIQSGNWKEL